MIMDYNRVVRDLGGMTEEAFYQKCRNSLMCRKSKMETMYDR